MMRDLRSHTTGLAFNDRYPAVRWHRRLWPAQLVGPAAIQPGRHRAQGDGPAGLERAVVQAGSTTMVVTLMGVSPLPYRLSAGDTIFILSWATSGTRAQFGTLFFVGDN